MTEALALLAHAGDAATAAKAFSVVELGSMALSVLAAVAGAVWLARRRGPRASTG